jgi:hypothetical protein
MGIARRVVMEAFLRMAQRSGRHGPPQQANSGVSFTIMCRDMEGESRGNCLRT